MAASRRGGPDGRADRRGGRVSALLLTRLDDVAALFRAAR